jgi:hypothetical protein
MKRNPSRSGTRSLTDELAELRGLDATTLRQRWRVLYRTEAPTTKKSPCDEAGSADGAPTESYAAKNRQGSGD